MYNESMEILISLFVFVFGLIVGSFLNVVILRYNTGQSLGGRSGCLYCLKQLGFKELIPIFSYIFQRGHCRKCYSKLTIQYPLVEFFTGLLFLLIFLNLQNLILSELVFALTVASILVVIFVYDIHHKIIPNGLVYAFAIISLIHLIYSKGLDYLTDGVGLLDLFAGPILFLPFYFLWYISKGRWIGLGDGKLALGIGWLLGFVGGLSAIVLSFWIGAVFSILLLLILRLKEGGGNITIKSEIPFAPFMIIATLIIYFFEYDVLGISFLLLHNV